MNELAHQARLAHARFADECHDLAATVDGKLLYTTELLQLELASDKPRETTGGSDLKPSSRGGGTRQFMDLYRLSKPLHRHGTKGLHGNVAFHQTQGGRRCEHRTGLCHLLQTCREVRGLAHNGVVHVQVVADSTDDDLS